MMNQTILQHIVNLKSRQGWKKSQYFVCEGLRCCQEAFQHKPDWVEAIIIDDAFDQRVLPDLSPIEVVKAASFSELANTENPQGIMALMRRPDVSSFPDELESTVMVLDRVADPGNVGTILRTAWAMGFSTVVWTKGTCHPFGAKAIRAGMGAQFALNLPCIPSLNDLKTLYPGRTMWLTSPRASVSCDSTEFNPTDSFVVVGNEAEGVSESAEANYVKIPMPGNAESLNVAQAATVFMYDIMRRR